MINHISDVNEASVYDDGYNRKKSKKRKKKQNTDKAKKTKSKEKDNVNMQNIEMLKIELKTDTNSFNSFGDMSQENSDEIPIIQGNYNDDIIIHNDPIDDPLKIDDDLTEIEKSAKKKKRQSKQSGQKRIKTKTVSKSKRKQDNVLPILGHTSTLDVSDASVQYNNIIPDFNAKDISSNQGNINTLSRNTSLSTEMYINAKDKTTVNTSNSNQIPNSTSYRNASTVRNSTETQTTYSSINTEFNSPSKPSTQVDIQVQANFDKNLCVNENKNSGCQNESTKSMLVHTSSCTNVNTTGNNPTITNSGTIRKDILKAAKFRFTNTNSSIRFMSQTQPENSSGNQKNIHMSMSNIVWQGIKAPPNMLFLSNNITYPTNFNHNPPVLQKESQTQHGQALPIANKPKIFSQSSEHVSMLRIPDINIAQAPILERQAIFPSSFSQQPFVIKHDGISRSEIKPLISTSDGSKEAAKRFWGTNTTILNRPDQKSTMNKQSFGQMNVLPFSSSLPPKTNPVLTSQCSTAIYPPAQITLIGNKPCSQSVDMIENPISTITKQNVSKISKANTSCQKSTPRKKSSSTKDTGNKSSNNASNASSNASHSMNPANTVIRTQVDAGSQYQFIDTLNKTLSENNTHDVQIAVPSDEHSIEKTLPADRMQYNEEQCSIASDVPCTDIPSQSSLLNFTQGRITLIKRKYKELKKSTTRKKQQPSIELAESQLTQPSMQQLQPQQQSQVTGMLQVCNSLQQPASLILGHISDMMYPNVPNGDLLRAFNDYWSTQVSHCALCATFASCTSGSSREMPPDWKYCNSTTLPESTPIWVSK